jgi:hypothetical protein
MSDSPPPRHAVEKRTRKTQDVAGSSAQAKKPCVWKVTLCVPPPVPSDEEEEELPLQIRSLVEDPSSRRSRVNYMSANSRKIINQRNDPCYEAAKEGPDLRFWSYFHVDCYNSVYESKRNHVVQCNARYDWNEEVILQFYSTFFFHKNSSGITWMTDEVKYSISIGLFASILGLGASTKHSLNLHDGNVLGLSHMASMYETPNFNAPTITNFKPEMIVLHSHKEDIGPLGRVIPLGCLNLRGICSGPSPRGPSSMLLTDVEYCNIQHPILCLCSIHHGID